MSIGERLSQALASAHEVPFDDASKLIFFSDCHRGDNGWADDFAHNESLFLYALTYYFGQGFTYVEVGDGDELWENKHFADIRRAHSQVFWKMRDFYEAGRLYLIYGNHDRERSDPAVCRHTLGASYYDVETGREERLFAGIMAHEALLLRHSETDYRILVAHGHQGDLVSDYCWRCGRFFVRHIWKHLQTFGLRDFTSPATRLSKQRRVDHAIAQWALAHNQAIICGHTHRARFPDVGDPPYFNTGSCVHPRSITGIEIAGGEIVLVRWWITAGMDGTGNLRCERTLLAPARRLRTLSGGAGMMTASTGRRGYLGEPAPK
jgi:UDP-2,3-diacylglucosamine pyrophosphatase LpxH